MESGPERITVVVGMSPSGVMIARPAKPACLTASTLRRAFQINREEPCSEASFSRTAATWSPKSWVESSWARPASMVSERSPSLLPFSSNPTSSALI